MSNARGFTFLETIVAGFLIISSLAIASKMLTRPLEISTVLTPRAQAQQKALALQQAQVDQLKTMLAVPPANNPTPVPTATPGPLDAAFHISLADDTALAAAATATNTLSLYSCANVAAGQTVQIGTDTSLEDATVATVGTPGSSPCTVTLAAAVTKTHAQGELVVPVKRAADPIDTGHTIYFRALTALVTYPRLGSFLTVTAASNATQIVLYDTSELQPNSWLRIGGAVGETTQFIQVSSISGNTVLLNTPLTGARSLYSFVGVAANLTGSQINNRCLLVDNTSLFVVNRAVQIDMGANMESGIVRCIGTGCGCTLASIPDPTKQVMLARPLRLSHATSRPVVPALFSAGSFNMVITGGGQSLGN